MSLYNNLFGIDTHSDLLLHILKLTSKDVPRYRDCYYSTQHHQIVIHTRTGGGNREYYDSEESCRDNYPEYFEGENIPCGPWNDDLQAHPLYLRDEDDDFDCTYADFYFSVPEEYAEELKEAYKNHHTITPAEKWGILFKKMDDMK